MQHGPARQGYTDPRWSHTGWGRRAVSWQPWVGWRGSTSQGLQATPPTPDPGHPNTGRPWEWHSIDGSVMLPLAPGSVKALADKYALCLTGDGLAHLQAADPQQLLHLIPHVHVFARVAPKQKVGGARDAAGAWGTGAGPGLSSFLPRRSWSSPA